LARDLANWLNLAHSYHLRMQAGDTPLHIAAAQGNHHILKALLREASGNSVNTADQHGRTALHVCASNSGDVSQKPKCIATLVHYGADLEAQDAAGLTALLYAADSGNLPAVKILVKLGASLYTTTPVRIPFEPHNFERSLLGFCGIHPTNVSLILR
jgi:ankyrin repeat protein